MSRSSTSPYDGSIATCIDHLSDNAEKYYKLVREKKQEGILWAVFVLSKDPMTSTPRKPGPGTPRTQRREMEKQNAPPEVNLKRAAFLPLTSVLSTNAQSLIQMFNQCDHKSQFVTWFTLEVPSGDPVVSKVMIVDASEEGPSHTEVPAQYLSQHNQQQSATTPQKRTGGAGSGGGAFKRKNQQENGDMMGSKFYNTSAAQNVESPATRAGAGGGRDAQKQQQQSTPKAGNTATNPSNKTPQQQHGSFISPRSPMSAASSPSPSEADGIIQGLKTDMSSFEEQHHRQQQQQQQKRYTPPASSAKQRERYISELEKNTAVGGRGSHIQLQDQRNEFELSPRGASVGRDASDMLSQARNALMSGNQGGGAAQQYHQILRVSLSVADTVAKIGAAVDALTERVDRIEQHLSTATKPPPPELIQTLLNRIADLESRQGHVDDRVNAFGEVQEKVFQQLEQHKKQTVEAVEQLTGQHYADPATIRADKKIREPISYSARQEERAKLRQDTATARAEAIARSGSASSQPRRTPPVGSLQLGGVQYLSSGEDDESSRDISPTRQPKSSSGEGVTPPVQVKKSVTISQDSSSIKAADFSSMSATTRNQNSDRGTIGGQLSSSPRAGTSNNGSGSGGGSGGDDTLSDMIKTMERKLTRMSIPAMRAQAAAAEKQGQPL